MSAKDLKYKIKLAFLTHCLAICFIDIIVTYSSLIDHNLIKSLRLLLNFRKDLVSNFALINLYEIPDCHLFCYSGI